MVPSPNAATRLVRSSLSSLRALVRPTRAESLGLVLTKLLQSVAIVTKTEELDKLTSRCSLHCCDARLGSADAAMRWFEEPTRCLSAFNRAAGDHAHCKGVANPQNGCQGLSVLDSGACELDHCAPHGREQDGTHPVCNCLRSFGFGRRSLSGLPVPVLSHIRKDTCRRGDRASSRFEIRLFGGRHFRPAHSKDRMWTQAAGGPFFHAPEAVPLPHGLCGHHPRPRRRARRRRRAHGVRAVRHEGRAPPALPRRGRRRRPQPITDVDRDWFRAAMTAPTRAERIGRMAGVSAGLMERAGPLLGVAQQPEAVEPGIAATMQAGRDETGEAFAGCWRAIGRRRPVAGRLRPRLAHRHGQRARPGGDLPPPHQDDRVGHRHLRDIARDDVGRASLMPPRTKDARDAGPRGPVQSPYFVQKAAKRWERASS